MKPWLTLSAMIASLTTLGVLQANAQIISDTYTDANGTDLASHTPDINQPGGTYVVGGQYGGPNGGEPTIIGDQLQLNTNAGDAISISSNGGYTKPTEFTISEELSVDTITDDGFHRGIGIGFFSAGNTPSTPGSTGDFTGLLLETNGSLQLVIGGNYGFPTVPAVAYDAADFGGAAFSASSFYTLSYGVNTTTGGISSVTLSSSSGSQTASFSTTAFTDTATAFAGTYATAAQGNEVGIADNFSVTPISTPEPSTWAMMFASLVVLVGIQRFTRKV